MLRSRSAALLVLLECWLGSGRILADAVPAAMPDGGSAWRRTPLVVGAPGRLDAEGDRRFPRFYQRAESAVAAYADVEEVADDTWLRHEIESYARRAVDCTGFDRTWCRREVERLGGAHAIHLASGAHAELVWLSRGKRVVRLGWRRIVETRTGTMTLDAPPADFTAQVLAEFPSQLGPLAFDAAREHAWAENEVDRLLYYIDQVIAGLPPGVADQHRRRAERFIEENLAQIVHLRALQLDAVELALASLPHGHDPSPTPGALPPYLAGLLDAVHAWRSDGALQPWCAERPACTAVAWPP